MPFLVRDILLVSTLYDSFILDEDGRFSDKLLSEYLELHLSSPPRLTRVPTGADALELLMRRPFDLVISMPRIGDMDPPALARAIKEIRPETPVALLAYDRGNTARMSRYIDKLFMWKGDSGTLLALVKSVEDQINVAHDTSQNFVRVMIVVEDSPVYYSSFLPLLYTEIMEQTRSPIAGGIMSLPHNGVQNQNAGFELVEYIRQAVPDLPILLQSAEVNARQEAAKHRVSFADKNSDDLLLSIRRFIRHNCGFGDFVFRLPDGTPVGRATNSVEMKQALATVPAESLWYHTRQNHVSSWLMARGKFVLALELRDKSPTHYQDIESFRIYLVNVFTEFLERRQRGHITEFSRSAHHLGRDFQRLAGGSLGGKGRGVAFIYKLLAKSPIHEKYPDVHILVPRTAVICTDEYDRFMTDNQLRQALTSGMTDADIAAAFIKARISNDVHGDLEALLGEVRYPLAIRSSSLLEDSQFQPFAGVYATHLIPNNDPTMRVRMRQLRRAIKLVYASTWFNAARAYMGAIHHRAEEEKMAVLIQRLVGANYGDRFYPTFSGVAQSHNYYPIRYMEPQDGIAVVALGLGRTVVGGGKALRFSPAHPQILPQMSSPADMLRNTQRQFWALAMSRPRVRVTAEEATTLVECELKTAGEDGALEHIGATYDARQDRVYDTIHRPGVRILNFAGVLKYDRFPLAELLRDVLRLSELAMGCPVEMEFAVNLNVEAGEQPEFAVLQIRPLVTAPINVEHNVEELDADRVLLRSGRALGNGRVEGIEDVVFIGPDRFDNTCTVAMAEEVASINAALVDQARPYMLIGPGRWGTSDRMLGIPVDWSQVSAARIIVEIGMEGFDVDPSQGTHFFHNITSLKVGYLAVDKRREDEALDWAFLEKQKTITDGKYARHVRLEQPLEALVDGRKGVGVVLRADGD